MSSGLWGRLLLFPGHRKVKRGDADTLCLCRLTKATEQDMEAFYSQGIIKDEVCYADATFDPLEMLRRAKKVKKADLIRLIAALYEMDAAKTCLSRCHRNV